MAKFIHHEPISCGYFNKDFCSAGGSCAAWASELTNSPKSLDFLMQRLHLDFEGSHAKMRKAFTARDVAPRLLRFAACFDETGRQETLQKAACLFTAALAAFSQKYPPSFVKEEEPNIIKAFPGWK